MRKILWLKLPVFLGSLFLCCGLVHATVNTTLLTGTVIDPSTQAWLNGSWSATLSNPVGGTAKFTDGTPVPLTYRGQFDATGAFPVTTPVVGDNSRILPDGTAWVFTVCPVASAPCQTIAPIAITGASYAAGTYISARITDLKIQGSIGGVTPVTSNWAYSVGEILNQINGSGVTLTTAANHCYVWNTSAWISYCGAGGGGGGTPGAPDYSLQYNNLGTFAGSPDFYFPGGVSPTSPEASGTADQTTIQGDTIDIISGGENGVQICTDPIGSLGPDNCPSTNGGAAITLESGTAIELTAEADVDVSATDDITLSAGGITLSSIVGGITLTDTSTAGISIATEGSIALSDDAEGFSIADSSTAGIAISTGGEYDLSATGAITENGGAYSATTTRGYTIQNGGLYGGISITDDSPLSPIGILIREDSGSPIALFSTAFGIIDLVTTLPTLVQANGSEICTVALLGTDCASGGLSSQTATITSTDPSDVTAVCTSTGGCTSLSGVIRFTSVNPVVNEAAVIAFANPESCFYRANGLGSGSITTWAGSNADDLVAGSTFTIIHYATLTSLDTVDVEYTCTLN